MTLPDDIKAVVKAAIEWRDALKAQGINSLETGIGQAVYYLSPESLKMIEEA
jgi:hypothetical protein